jgi:hypothetical protein
MTRNPDAAEAALTREREKWMLACRARVAMWRHSADDERLPAQFREEARARANEAQFIADLIESGSPEF